MDELRVLQGVALILFGIALELFAAYMPIFGFGPGLVAIPIVLAGMGAAVLGVIRAFTARR